MGRDSVGGVAATGAPLPQMKGVFFFLFLLAVWVRVLRGGQAGHPHPQRERVEWIFRGAVYHSYLTIFEQLPTYIDGGRGPDSCGKEVPPLWEFPQGSQDWRRGGQAHPTRSALPGAVAPEGRDGCTWGPSS